MPVCQIAHDTMVTMEFNENACYHALNAVGGYSIDLALEWLVDHMHDESINYNVKKEFFEE